MGKKPKRGFRYAKAWPISIDGSKLAVKPMPDTWKHCPSLGIINHRIGCWILWLNPFARTIIVTAPCDRSHPRTPCCFSPYYAANFYYTAFAVRTYKNYSLIIPAHRKKNAIKSGERRGRLACCVLMNS